LWGLFARSTINYTATIEVEDLTKNPKVHELGKSGFKIAVGLYSSTDSFLDRKIMKYLNLKVFQLNQDYISEEGWEHNVRELKLER
jgi:uncharacterized Fe-S cluster-containing MiaB family protein